MTLSRVVQPESRHVVVGDLRLHYLDWGGPGGTVVVFLHGGALNAHSWDAVCLALRDRYRCLALDLRGHGDSDWSLVADYDLDAHAGDVEGFLHLWDMEDVVLVGHSLGAYAALRYASRGPAPLQALVIVDASPFAARQAQLERLTDFLNTRVEFRGLEEAIEAAREFNPRRHPELLKRSLAHSMRSLPGGGLIWKRDPRQFTPQRIAEIASASRSSGGELCRITCPTLMVRGADSGLSDDDAAEIAGAVPDGRWACVPGAGHNVPGDSPGGLVKVLQPFLSEVTSR